MANKINPNENIFVFYGEEKELINMEIMNLTQGRHVKVDNYDVLKKHMYTKSPFTDSEWFVMYDDEDILAYDFKVMRSRTPHKIILVYTKVDKRLKFFKDAKGHLFEFKRMKTNEMVRYIMTKLPVNKKNATFIADACCNSLQAVNNEIFKLNHIKKLTDEAIEELVVRNPEDQIFEMIDRVLRHDKTAYQYYDDLIFLGESPVKMVSIMYGQFRNQLILGAYPNKTDKAIADSTDLSYWQVKMSRHNAGFFPEARIVEILLQIQQLEVDIKTGKQDAKIGFEHLLANILKGE